MSLKNNILSPIVATVKDAARISTDLFKIMIPVLIVVKILQVFDLVGYIATPLSPIMELVGLPGEMGLVWATALLNNIYSSMLVLLSLVQDQPITAAQATVLGTMILVAHSMPVELRVVQSSGPKIGFQALIRLGGAFIMGFILNQIYQNFDLLQGPAKILLTTDNSATDETILQWALGQIHTLTSIFGIIFCLLVIMKILTKIRVLAAMDFLLRPFLTMMGIGSKASALTVVGLTMGLSYGGGMIIHETKSGRINKKDVFYSLTLMSLCHSLIEDTLLLMMIGGHISGLLWGRLIMSCLLVAALVQASKSIPDSFADKYLWGLPKQS